MLSITHVREMLASNSEVRILGIDPGSRLCGYAFVTSRPPFLVNRACVRLDDVGVIRADLELEFCNRIGLIHTALHQLVSEHRPDVCIIEDAFFGLNARSALKLGQARGALITAVMRENVPVIEVTPTHVKKSIVGNGGADKDAVSSALKALIGFDRGALPYDVSDALAIALSFGLTLPGLRASGDYSTREAGL